MSTIRGNFAALPPGEQSVVELGSAAPVLADTFAGRVHVEWDNTATVTPFGQLPFFIEYLKQGGLFDKLLRPVSRTWTPKPITSSSMKIGDFRPPDVADFTKRSVSFTRFCFACMVLLSHRTALQSGRLVCGQQDAQNGILPGRLNVGIMWKRISLAPMSGKRINATVGLSGSSVANHGYWLRRAER